MSRSMPRRAVPMAHDLVRMMPTAPLFTTTEPRLSRPRAREEVCAWRIRNSVSMGGLDLGGIAVLFAVAAVAGCFDAIAGGGGLLTIPALLLAGLDPVSAIATNKLQGAAATLSATATFARRGLIDWRTAVPVAATAGLGSVVGAFCVSLVSRSVLEGLVPVLLMTAAVYFALGRR